MQVSLKDYLAQGKYVVLFFYPLDFTFVCPTGEFLKAMQPFISVNITPRFLTFILAMPRCPRNYCLQRPI